MIFYEVAKIINIFKEKHAIIKIHFLFLRHVK